MASRRPSIVFVIGNGEGSYCVVVHDFGKNGCNEKRAEGSLLAKKNIKESAIDA